MAEMLNRGCVQGQSSPGDSATRAITPSLEVARAALFGQSIYLPDDGNDAKDEIVMPCDDIV